MNATSSIVSSQQISFDPPASQHGQPIQPIPVSAQTAHPASADTHIAGPASAWRAKAQPTGPPASPSHPCRTRKPRRTAHWKWRTARTPDRKPLREPLIKLFGKKVSNSTTHAQKNCRVHRGVALSFAAVCVDCSRIWKLALPSPKLRGSKSATLRRVLVLFSRCKGLLSFFSASQLSIISSKVVQPPALLCLQTPSTAVLRICFIIVRLMQIGASCEVRTVNFVLEYMSARA